MPDRPNRSAESIAQRRAYNREWYRRKGAAYKREYRSTHRDPKHAEWGSPEHRAKSASALAARNRARKRPIEQRFWPKVEKTTACWLWTGALDHQGYGIFDNRKAHRVSYELTEGLIPAGLQIDHLCFVRNCVNPEHLEPVTAQENIRRSRAR